jgi:hypothetical protein
LAKAKEDTKGKKAAPKAEEKPKGKGGCKPKK